MPKPQELALPSFVEQETVLPLDQEIFNLVDESVKRQIELERLDPGSAVDIPRIQSIIKERQAIADAPRTITGERQLQVPEFIESSLSYLGPFEQPARALLPKAVLTPGEVKRAEQDFEAKVLPDIYAKYRESVQQGTEPDPGIDLSTKEAYQNFQEAMKEKYGSRGQYIIEDGVTARFKTGAEILGTEILATEVPTPAGPEVQERLVGTLLRDLLVIEAGVTAAGQEVGELFSGKRVGKKDFNDRWAENIQQARGLEQLASDITGDTLEGLGLDEDTSNTAADIAWWVGLGAGFVLPIDFYLGAAAKGASKSFKRAASAAADAGARPGKASGVARLVERLEAAEDIGINPADVRLDIAEEAAAIGKYGDEAEDIISGATPVTEVNKLDVQEASRQAQETLSLLERSDITNSTYPLLLNRFIKHVADNPVFDETGKLVVPTLPAILKNKITPEIASDAVEFLTDQLATRLSRRALKESIEKGKSVVPEGYTMLTPRIAVPQAQVNPILRSFKDNVPLQKILDTFQSGAAALSDEGRLSDILKTMGIPDPELDTRFIGKAFGDMSSILAGSKKSQDEINKVVRTFIDAVVEYEAGRLSPTEVLSAVELERLYSTSADIAKQAAVRVEADVIGKVPATRAERIRSVRNIERINDIVTPKELKKSGFVKLMTQTKNYIAPEGFQLNKYPFNKYFKVPGIAKPPIYRATFGKLLDRLGNIGEELRTEYGRIKVGENLDDIQAYGKLHSTIYSSPQQHFLDFMRAGYGASDDVGTALGTRFGLNQFMSTNQVLAEQVIKKLSSTEGPIQDLFQLASQFDEFSPEYFEFLSGVGVVLSGKSVDTIQPSVRNILPSITADNMPVWRLNPEKTGSNIANLLVSAKRTKIVNDFAEDIAKLHPEIFERPLPAILNSWIAQLDSTLTWTDTLSITKVLEARGLERGVDFNPRQVAFVVAASAEAMIRTQGDALDLLREAFKDRVAVAQGVDPINVESWLFGKVIEESEVLMTLRELDQVAPRVAEQVLFSNGAAQSFLSELFKETFFNNVFVNTIFNETYASSISRNIPPERVSAYFDALETKIVSKQIAEDNTSSFVKAVEDLPLYAFDRPDSIRADIMGILDDSSLVRRYLTVNQRWVPIDESLGEVVSALSTRDLDVFLEQTKTLQKSLSVMTDTSPGYARLARRIGNFTASELYNSFGYVRNITKGGILAGNMMLNPKYHIVNVLSAPSIVLATLGAKAAVRSAMPQGATEVLKHLYSFEFGGVIPVGNPTKVLVETPTGKKYTVGEVADLVQENNISISQVKAEIPNQIFEDLVRWTGENFGEFGRSEPVLTFLRAIYDKTLAVTGATGRTVFGEFASATDNYFRVNVLLSSLRDGVTEADAIRKARESLFDYNNLTKFERDVVMKGVWIYSFRAQSFRVLLSNILNNPTRLAQQYKLVRGLPADEEESYTPFMTKYKNSKVMMGIYEDPETRLRFALYGPDVPLIDAMDDLVSVSSYFVALAAGEASLSGSLAEAGLTALGETDPVLRTPLTAGGYEVAFGDVSPAGTYVNPGYINFLVATGNWETFKTTFNIVGKAPRRGKPTYGGVEWAVNRKDKVARKNFLLFRNALLLAGLDRPVREWSDILVPQVDGDPTRYGTGTPWWDIGVATGVVGMEQMQDEAQRQQTLSREIGQELR